MNEPYKLPEGWKWIRLGEVCEFEYGSGLPERDRVSGSVPVFGSNGFVGYHNVAITNGSTIIIGRKGSIGQVNYSESPCWPIDTTYYIDSSKTNCNLIWLYWLLKFLKLDLLNKATGVPGLNRKDAYNQIIPLPPLDDQRRIAAKIHEFMQDVERARNACEKQLEAAKALPAAYPREIFESKEAKKWDKKGLGEVCERIIGGGTPSRGHPEYWGGNIYCLSPSELEEGKLTYVSQTREKITEEGSRNSNAKIIPPKSILLTCTASIGKIAINVVPLTTNQQFNSFVLKNSMAESEFIAYYLIYKREEIKQLGGKTTFRFISKDEIAELPIILPNIDIQHRIASELKEKMAYAEKLRTSIEKQLGAINALHQAILRKAFRGEL